MYQVNLEAISKKFGTTPVIHNLTLEIRRGELFFLLGPSGCGKTTLLRILAGFEFPDQGIVQFDTRDMTRTPPQKRHCSLVFQSYALWPHLSVKENVAYGLENQRLNSSVINKKVVNALSLVRMDEYADRLPNQLSGGQQQRIALARALVVEPQLLLLDEPLSNLDARLRAQMRIELQRLHRKTGVTTVYVTHDQEEALSLADRIGFMDQGRLIQIGSARELYNAPATVGAARFLGNANLVPGRVIGLSGNVIVVETALGTIKGRAKSGEIVTAGETVHCFFRPERVAATTGAENTMEGTVSASLYAGVAEHLFFECNGISLQALQPPAALPTPVGEKKSWGVKLDDMHILRHTG